jgi:hypothetical protein
MGNLTEDPAFLSTTFVVIDFEATTPAGRPAQQPARLGRLPQQRICRECRLPAGALSVTTSE